MVVWKDFLPLGKWLTNSPQPGFKHRDLLLYCFQNYSIRGKKMVFKHE